MNWEDYVFIYEDSLGMWNVATNPVFIAEQSKCKAVLKTDTDTLKYYLVENGYQSELDTEVN